MSDTLITVVAILLAVVLLVVIPLQVTSQRVDTMSKLDVDTLTSDFVEQIRTTGELTKDDYYNFNQKLTSTGNTFDINMEFKILDENPGKKTTQTTRDKIGENVYYSVYTSQIEQALEKDGDNVKYSLKEGDLVSVTVRNTNLTIGQQLKNFAYKVIGNDTYTIFASKSGLVLANGSTSTVIADGVEKPELTAKFYENNANGKVITKNNTDSSELTNQWTNKNVYVELGSKDNYNLNLLYYKRDNTGNKDYYNYKPVPDGNHFTIDQAGEYAFQAFWKLEGIEKYSEIKTIKVKIDRTAPTVKVDIPSGISNSKTIKINAQDQGGSGLAGYYYAWSEPNQSPSIDNAKWTDSNYIYAKPENNNKKITVWAKDNAGNISTSSSAIAQNIFYPITDVKLNNAVIKQGESATLSANLTGGNSYQNIKFETSDSSIAEISPNGTNVKVTGKKAGKATIRCTVTNYDGQPNTVTAEATVIVTTVEYSPNGGTYKISYTDKNERVTLRSTVNVYGGPSRTEYAWSNSNTQVPSNWQQFTTGREVTNTVANPGNYYLWIRALDQYNNSTTFVSNNFHVKYKIPDATLINIGYSNKKWTNNDVYVALNSDIKDYKIQISTNGKDWNYATSYKFIENGTIYVRFYDEQTKEAGSIRTVSVTNIDKVPAQITQQLQCVGKDSNSLRVRIGAIDANSGFSKVVWNYTVISTGESHTIEDIECDMNGYTTGNRDAVIKERNITNLIPGNMYAIYADVYDVAGNFTRTYGITTMVGKKTGSLGLSSNAGSTCIGNKKYFTVNYNDSGGALSVSSDNPSVAVASISGNTVTVTPKGVGNANITVTSNETDIYYKTTQNYQITFYNHIAETGGSKKSDATCTVAETHYYKCKTCGTQLSSIYTVGNPLGHNFTSEKIMGNWKFTENNGNGGTGKIAAVFNRAGQYARFTYTSYGTHTMNVLYCTEDPNSSIDLCLGTSTSATTSTIAFRAWGNGYKTLYRDGREALTTKVDTEKGSNGMYNSIIEWGHGGTGTWTFTVFSNSDNTAAHPTTCVRKYCSRCSHYEDYYNEF